MASDIFQMKFESFVYVCTLISIFKSVGYERKNCWKRIVESHNIFAVILYLSSSSKVRASRWMPEAAGPENCSQEIILNRAGNFVSNQIF